MKQKSVQRRLPWKKRLLFAGVISLGILLLVEAVCWFGLWLLATGSLEKLHEERTEYAQAENVDAAQEVMHPYLGWVLNPENNPGRSDDSGHTHAVNKLGLVDSVSPFRRRADDKVIVGVMGGSVSWYVATTGNGRGILDSLEKSERYRGKKLELVNLAMHGYKQPQQLLLLTYLLSMGAEFDILVNIDGYNEIALHEVENAQEQVFPSYPRAWKARIQDRPEPQFARTAAHYWAMKAGRQGWAQFMSTFRLQRTATVNFLWKCFDNRYSNAIRRDLKMMVVSRDQKSSYQVTGPKRQFANRDEMYEFLSDYWKSCSLQMDRICRANGIEYHHVLQPNQYVEKSKPISPKERSVAILPNSPYGTAARFGYPFLIRKGAELHKAGVHFHDLTLLFQQMEQPIYIDDCCHYNPEGNRAVANEITKRILETSPPPRL